MKRCLILALRNAASAGMSVSQIEIGKNLSAKNAVIMRMPMWMLQKLFCRAVWMDGESIWMLYRESLGNRIKVPPKSLLEDRENHPRWWMSLGTIREFQQLELFEWRGV